MPWGWECREKFVKQRPAKDTKREHPISHEFQLPGPGAYNVPEIVGGPGYSKIKRGPAYTFGNVLKPIVKRNAKAKMFDVRGMGPKGFYRIPGSVISPQIEPLPDKTKVPGPGTYVPRGDSRYKRTPAYSMYPVARPVYKPWDQWTPPPNMYCPPIPDKKYPAYSFGNQHHKKPPPSFPGPGQHDPNFRYTRKSKPAFSFGAPFRPQQVPKVPAPNTYCEKKFTVGMRSAPAPSFGILHTPYLGKQAHHLKRADLKINIAGDT